MRQTDALPKALVTPDPRTEHHNLVVSLITSGSTEQLRGHLQRAKDNGLSETELKEAIVHMAFYAGWPKAMSALHAAIDAAYHRKYDRYGPAIVGTVVGEQAAPATLRVVPQP